jgi:tetratricopeptide (TPR) repeat protein
MNQSLSAAPNTTTLSARERKSTLDLSAIGTWVLLGFLALLPVIIVPFTNNFIGHSKLFLILTTAIITALLFFIRSFKSRVWRVIVSPITLPLVLFGLAVAASTFFTENYPVQNLLGLGGVYLSSILLAVLGSSLIKKEKADWVIPTMVVSACVVSIASLLQLFGWGPTRLINLITGFEIEHNLIFNLSSSSFVAIQVTIVALVGAISRLLKTKKISTFEVITLPILVFGLGLHLWSLLPSQQAAITLPPLSSGWSVALDSLRVPKAALIGQGPEAYATTFARYKPTWLNGEEYWQYNFGSAMGLPLTFIVQLGFLGLAAWAILAARFFATSKKSEAIKSSPLTVMLVAIFLMQLVLPPSYILLGLQGALLAFWMAKFSDEFSTLKLRALSATFAANSRISASKNNNNQTEKVFSLATNGIVIAGLLIVGYMTGKAYASYHQLYLANKALVANDGVAVYEHQRQAVTLNPYLDSTRRSYASTNLQIATALSNKTDVTEQEQEQISQLVQQAVREANAATTIDPLDSTNWSILAQIYEQLIGSVEEADQWAVNAYVSAIQVSPADPLLRIQLGNVLLGQEDAQQAANLFSQAVNLKPDLAAGYYHLGRAQQLGQDLLASRQSWQQALALLIPESEDYVALTQGLEQLEEAIEAAGLNEEPVEGVQGQVPGAAVTPDAQTAPGQSTLGQEIPSLTDQNLESNEEAISQPATEPLELTQETEEVVNEANQPVEAEAEPSPAEEGEPAPEETPAE